MSKHTPGPWTFVDGSEYCFPSVLIGYRDGLRYSDKSGDDQSSHRSCRMVINVGPSAEGLENGVVSNEMPTILANARLIAAAPELLGALESVLENCLDPDGLAAAYAKSRAAIAKATGAKP